MKQNKIQRKRLIKQLGGSKGIHMTEQDLHDFNLIVGDYVDISEITKVEVKQK